MNIGIDFWSRKEFLKVSIYTIFICFISLLGNYFYGQYNKIDKVTTVNSQINNELTNKKEYYQEDPVMEQPKSSFINNNKVKRKKVYLTFDDGPSYNITAKILEILKDRKIKATFFVIGKNVKEFPDLVIKTQAEGHSIGNHSYTHNYKAIYGSVENFLGEIDETDKALKHVLGDKYSKKIFRFPGGGFNREKQFKEALKEKGYEFYDWNCLNGDAEGISISKDKLVNKVKATTNGQEKLIILMHDMETKQTTCEALNEIIDYLEINNYEFATL